MQGRPGLASGGLSLPTPTVIRETNRPKQDFEEEESIWPEK